MNRLNRAFALKHILCTLAILLAGPAVAVDSQAASSHPSQAGIIDTGPPDAYGEVSLETANKQVVFGWMRMALVEGRVEDAFRQYVSPRFRDYGHQFRPESAGFTGYDAALKRSIALAQQVHAGTVLISAPVAAVNGEMVTVYGKTLDVYEVQNGQIVGHWDAAPPREITIKAHAPGTAERVMSGHFGVAPPPPTEAELHPNLTGITPQALDTGPVSPRGESPQETANKQVAFEWSHLSWIQGNFPAAFALYYSQDFKAHSHILTQGKHAYASYADALASDMGAQKRMLARHIALAVPTMATADGDLVIMFGEGVDIFRVRQGKITDSWNASPPITVTLEPPGL